MARAKKKQAGVVHDLEEARITQGNVEGIGEVPDLGISEDVVQSHANAEVTVIERIVQSCRSICGSAANPAVLADLMPRYEKWVTTLAVGTIAKMLPTVRRTAVPRTFLVFAENLPPVYQSLELLVLYGTQIRWIDKSGKGPKERPLLEIPEKRPPNKFCEVIGGTIYASHHPDAKQEVISALKDLARRVRQSENKARLANRDGILKEMSQRSLKTMADLSEGHASFSFDCVPAHRHRDTDFPTTFLNFELIRGSDRVRLIAYYVDAERDNPRLREVVESRVSIPRAVIGQQSVPTYNGYDDDKRRSMVILTILANRALTFIEKGGSPRKMIAKGDKETK